MFTFFLLVASTIAIALLAARTVQALYRYRYRHVKLAASDLPTVSVCVAARNEMHALAECLERVLKSDYPKLEVLVLDDSSNDDTSLIIKSFARAGVRFIAGSPLPEGWLGKNHAYQTLISESSGEYILFIDVDTTLASDTISQLMSELISSGTSMISVLPRREDSYRLSALFGTLRYYWELVLGTQASPPAASALWMVSRLALAEAGVGLANYSQSVRPERYLARQLQRKGQYRYLVGTKRLGVGYEKRLQSQYETALRLYYPMSGRIFLKWLGTSLYIGLLIAPLIIAILNSKNALSMVWAIILILMIAITLGLFVHRTYGGMAWIIRMLLGPILMAQELVLLTLSHTKYRLGRVTWKGRMVTAQPNKHDALKLDE